jgi:hypothetical protein
MVTPPFSFNYTNFIAQFPQFSNTDVFPESLLSMYWAIGNSYIANSNYGRLNCANRQLALDLICAHLVQQNTITQEGQTPYVLSGATIDKITVQLDPPPKPNQWQWFLNTTVYGQQLLALLQAHSVGGFYVTTSPSERTSFRKAYGTFGTAGIPNP